MTLTVLWVMSQTRLNALAAALVTFAKGNMSSVVKHGHSKDKKVSLQHMCLFVRSEKAAAVSYIFIGDINELAGAASSRQ